MAPGDCGDCLGDDAPSTSMEALATNGDVAPDDIGVPAAPSEVLGNEGGDVMKDDNAVLAAAAEKIDGSDLEEDAGALGDVECENSDAELLRARTRRLDSFAADASSPPADLKTGVTNEFAAMDLASPKDASHVGTDGNLPEKPAPSLIPGADQLMNLAVPVVTRRDQLNANFRNKGKNSDGDGEEMGEGEVAESVKPKAKAKAKGNGKAKASPKAKAKTKASAKAKAKASVKSKAKASPKKSAKKTGDGPKRSKKDEKGEKDEVGEVPSAKRAARGSANTWARRYPPTDPSMLFRHNAIKDIFESQIAPLLVRQSSFQETLWESRLFV